MKFVVKVGGSILFPENGPNKNYIKKLLPVLKKIKQKNQLILSIGAGKYFRKYVYNIKELLQNDEPEWIFIELLKSNIKLFSFLTKLKPIYSLDEVSKTTSGIISGIKPKRSTDANASYCAKKIKSDLFIKMTDVNGIYNKDPKKFLDAHLLKKIKFSELGNFSIKSSPGNYGILDETAIELITKNKIKTIVMNAKNPKKLFDVIKGKQTGTLISD